MVFAMRLPLQHVASLSMHITSGQNQITKIIELCLFINPIAYLIKNMVFLFCFVLLLWYWLLKIVWNINKWTWGKDKRGPNRVKPCSLWAIQSCQAKGSNPHEWTHAPHTNPRWVGWTWMDESRHVHKALPNSWHSMADNNCWTERSWKWRNFRLSWADKWMESIHNGWSLHVQPCPFVDEYNRVK